MKCKICNKYCKSIRSLSSHLRYHDINLLNYYVKYENFKIPKCPYCNKDSKHENGLKYRLTCGNKKCILKTQINRKHTKETKEKLRKKLFERIKKEKGNTPYDKKRRGEMSYLENWFYINVIEKYKLYEKYDIVREYPFYPYFIDFAFLNIKLAVELDGGTHFNNDGSYIQRDLDKNKALLKNKWNLFRINYQEINKNKIQEFFEFIKNINILEPKMFESRIYKGKIVKAPQRAPRRKYKTRKLLLEQKRKESFLREQKNIELIKNSNIDFSKYGRGNEIAKLINKHPQKIQNWMRKYCPDIWEKAYKTKRAKDYLKL